MATYWHEIGTYLDHDFAAADILTLPPTLGRVSRKIMVAAYGYTYLLDKGHNASDVVDELELICLMEGGNAKDFIG